MAARFEYKAEGSFVPKGGVEKALSMPKFVKQLNRTILPKVERRADAILKKPAPPRGSETFVWSLQRAANERARRWWFWAVATGQVPTSGGHYNRSGVIPASWQVDILVMGGDAVMQLFNPAAGSEYVYGSTTQTQVPGHTRTGWPNLIKIGILLAEGVEQDIAEAWDEFARKNLK